MKVAFVIQGEGRGHLTQAISLSQRLGENNHELVAVFVGISGERKLPSFFKESIKAEIQLFSSPNFAKDKADKGINWAGTFLNNFPKSRHFVREAKKVKRQLEEAAPDLIVNFYEPLFGLINMLFPLKIPNICIAHQFLADHPSFELPEGSRWQRMGLRFLNRLSSQSAKVKFALSFYPLGKHSNTIVVPPLLRKELDAGVCTDENYFLVYLLNSGYGRDIIEWKKQHPEYRFHVFWDNEAHGDDYIPLDGLHFHQLNGELFLTLMKACSAVISTAGFETACEALYLGKPIAVVPVKGHYEQRVNSFDLAKTGRAVRYENFVFDRIIKDLIQLRQKESANSAKAWMRQIPHPIIAYLSSR